MHLSFIALQSKFQESLFPYKYSVCTPLSRVQYLQFFLPMSNIQTKTSQLILSIYILILIIHKLAWLKPLSGYRTVTIRPRKLFPALADQFLPLPTPTKVNHGSDIFFHHSFPCSVILYKWSCMVCTVRLFPLSIIFLSFNHIVLSIRGSLYC